MHGARRRREAIDGWGDLRAPEDGSGLQPRRLGNAHEGGFQDEILAPELVLAQLQPVFAVDVGAHSQPYALFRSARRPHLGEIVDGPLHIPGGGGEESVGQVVVRVVWMVQIVVRVVMRMVARTVVRMVERVVVVVRMEMRVLHGLVRRRAFGHSGPEEPSAVNAIDDRMS